MMTTDPIADMLTRMRNALSARHAKVDVPASRLKNDIGEDPGAMKATSRTLPTEDGTKKSIRIYLMACRNVLMISRIERVSRPGCRGEGAGLVACRGYWAAWESIF